MLAKLMEFEERTPAQYAARDSGLPSQYAARDSGLPSQYAARDSGVLFTCTGRALFEKAQ